MGKVAERRGRTTERIVAAALDVIGEEGAAGLSLGEVARRVGMRTPSLYGYFASRADLCDELFRRGWADFGGAVAHLVPEPGTDLRRDAHRGDGRLGRLGARPPGRGAADVLATDRAVAALAGGVRAGGGRDGPRRVGVRRRPAARPARPATRPRGAGAGLGRARHRRDLPAAVQRARRPARGRTHLAAPRRPRLDVRSPTTRPHPPGARHDHDHRTPCRAPAADRPRHRPRRRRRGVRRPRGDGRRVHRGRLGPPDRLHGVAGARDGGARRRRGRGGLPAAGHGAAPGGRAGRRAPGPRWARRPAVRGADPRPGRDCPTPPSPRTCAAGRPAPPTAGGRSPRCCGGRPCPPSPACGRVRGSTTSST